MTKADGKVHIFKAEVAATFEQQQKGMMFRDSMGEDEAMIFPHQVSEMSTFWMKNTLIPLDIIFVNDDATIGNIAAMTTPLSTEPVAATNPALMVLEIKGGRAAELGIKAGDKVEWPR